MNHSPSASASTDSSEPSDVSCNVTAAARDLKEITRAGYAVADVRCFDLFVETHHIETVVVLDRHSNATSRRRRRR